MPTVTDELIVLNDPTDVPGASAPGGHAPATRALALGEARRLTRSPLVLLGAGLSLVATFGNGWFADRVADLGYADQGVGFVLMPLLVGTLFATFLATTRSRRLHVDELEEPTLLPASAVTRARILAVLGPVAVSMLVTVLWLVELVLFFDGYGIPDLVDLVQGPLLVAMVGLAGTALGTWTSFRATPLLLLAAFVLPLTWAQDLGPIREFAWWREPQSWVNPDLLWRPSGAHATYLAGLVAVFAVLAVLRHGISGRRVAAGVLALTLAATGGSLQSQGPTDDELRERLALAQDAMQRAECETRDGIEYCVWPEHRPLIDHWHQVLTGVTSALPATAPADALTVKVWFGTDDSGLRDTLGATGVDPYFGGDFGGTPTAATAAGAEIVRAIQAGNNEVIRAPRGYTDAITMDPAWARGPAERTVAFALARDAAGRLVGLPTEASLIDRPVEEWMLEAFQRTGAWPGSDQGAPMPRIGDTLPTPTVCLSLGQARSAVALWAAASATPLTEQRAREALDPRQPGLESGDRQSLAYDLANPFFSDHFGGIHRGGPADIAWGRDDLHVAVQLLDRPADEVRAVLGRDWERWTDPSTPTSDLVAVFGLDAPPTAADRLADAGLDWQRDTSWAQEGPAAPTIRPDGTADPLTFGDPHAITCA